MNKSELNTCCLYTVAVQDNPIFIDKLLHCDSCKETLRYTGTRWQYEPFEGLCNSAKCETEHGHDEPPAPRAGERERVILNSDLVVRPMPNTLLKTKYLLTTDDDWPVAEFYREEEAEGIAYEHNQHATLVAQRERLLRLLRPVTSPTACYCAVMKDEKCWHCEARELIATIEREEV